MMMSLDEKKAELRKQQAAKRGVLKSDYQDIKKLGFPRVQYFHV